MQSPIAMLLYWVLVLVRLAISHRRPVMLAPVVMYPDMIEVAPPGIIAEQKFIAQARWCWCCTTSSRSCWMRAWARAGAYEGRRRGRPRAVLGGWEGTRRWALGTWRCWQSDHSSAGRRGQQGRSRLGNEQACIGEGYWPAA